MRIVTAVLGFLAVTGAALLGIGCGSEKQSVQMLPQRPAAKFPSPGQFAELQRHFRAGPNLAPSVSTLERGMNRFGFALFDNNRKPISGAAVAIYTTSARGTDLHGPYVARFEPITVKPAYLSKTSAQDPDSARGVYVAEIPFAKRGQHGVLALLADGESFKMTGAIPVAVSAGGGGPPVAGAKAIMVHTPTAREVSDPAQICTRVPPDTMHETDLATVLGKRPIVLVFATPQLCQSRVCGPVVDIADQLKASYANRAAFIHMEIYNRNRVQDGFRPQVSAWRLPSEPWTFVIDRSGRVVERFEGPYSPSELERAIKRVV